MNERRLYGKRDGSLVETSQVHARTSNHDGVFAKAGAFVWLRHEPAVIVPFRDEDAGFLEWLARNPAGFFINAERTPKPNYLVLHRSRCSHFTGSPSLSWTKDYVKFCSRMTSY